MPAAPGRARPSAAKRLRTLAIMDSPLRLRPGRPHATNSTRTNRQVLGEFREISGNLGDRPGMADRQFAFGPFRFDARTGELAAGSRRGQAHAARRRRARHAGRARAAPRQQAGAVRAGLGRPRGQRRRADLLHSGAAPCARRRCPPPALHRDPTPARLSADGAGDAGRRRSGTSHCRSPERRHLVGRAAEMAELARRFDLALSGQRQLVFVTGEPGIGKSALAEGILRRARPRQRVQDRARPVPRSSRRGRALSAADRSSDAACGRARRRAMKDRARDACAELARPDAVALDAGGAQRAGSARAAPRASACCAS